MKQFWNDTRSFIESHRDLCVEALRVYLGIGLLLKGFNFLFTNSSVLDLMSSPDIPVMKVINIHFIGGAHVVGGLLLALGLLTRLAAFIQVPILFGAVLFVHWSTGLFSTEPVLEFTMLVLFLLVFFAIYGSGRISVDSILERKQQAVPKDGD